MKILAHNIYQLLIAFDQFVNALTGLICFKEKIWADESLSSRAYRMDRDGVRSWPRKLIDAIFFWESDHCRDSYYSEVERRQCPPELRGRKGGTR